MTTTIPNSPPAAAPLSFELWCTVVEKMPLRHQLRLRLGGSFFQQVVAYLMSRRRACVRISPTWSPAVVEGLECVQVVSLRHHRRVEDHHLQMLSAAVSVDLKGCRLVSDLGVACLTNVVVLDVRQCPRVRGHTLPLLRRLRILSADDIDADELDERLPPKCHSLFLSYMDHSFSFSSPSAPMLRRYDCMGMLCELPRFEAPNFGTLQALNISRCRLVDDRTVVALSSLSSLTSLRMWACDAVTPHGFTAAPVEGLRVLDISFCHLLDNSTIEFLRRRATALQDLEMSRLLQVDERAFRLDDTLGLGVSSSLTALTLHYNRLQPRCVWPCFPRLRELNAADHEPADPMGLIAPLPACPSPSVAASLRALVLSDNLSLRDAHLHTLSACTSLHLLSVERCPGLRGSFLGALPSSLRTLALSVTTDRFDHQHFTALVPLSRLAELSLIDSDDVLTLSCLMLLAPPVLGRLTSLNVTNCRCFWRALEPWRLALIFSSLRTLSARRGDLSSRHLTQLCTLPQLAALDVRQCAALSLDAVRARQLIRHGRSRGLLIKCDADLE